MSFIIDDRETEDLIRKLATIRGTSDEEAVLYAVRQALRRRAGHDAANRMERKESDAD